jgi:L-fuculose-phosphate aldolase
VLLQAERQQVADTARQLLETGLVVNTSGNVSIRVGDQFAITPSGCAYHSITPADVVVVGINGDVIDGDLLPSSETPLHVALYESDASIGAIVHTHSVYATAVSTLVKELPAIHYQITTLGGPVPVAPYCTFGSPELAAAVTDAMKGRKAALMQNHGSTTVGANVAEALARTVTLEWLAQVYLIASQSGSPSTVSDEELQRVKERQKELADGQKEKLSARRQ